MAQGIEGEGDDEELEQELELLRAMWPSEEELKISRSTREQCAASVDVAAALLTARLEPNTGGNDQSQYLRCELVITIPFGYPGEPDNPVLPQLRIGASSGLTDARRDSLLATLGDLLRGDLAGLPGALPAVLEAAREQLTTWNDEGPIGQCPVCLAGFDNDGDASGQTIAPGLIRLPCYHVLHVACFAQVWEAEWLRQKESSKLVLPLALSEAVVACPECRQVASWAAVPQIHLPLQHLLVPVSSKTADALESDHRDETEEEEIARVDEGEAEPYNPSRHVSKQGTARSQKQQQSSAPSRVDLFEVVMARGLRTRLKPKWDARDHEGPILRNGACGVVAEFVEGKDATYLRPEGMEYWLPLQGGRNNCKMVRIDQDMPRPQKAPSGWIHGDNSLGADIGASTTGGAKVSHTEGKAPGKERNKKTKAKNADCGYSGDKILGA